MGCPYMMLDEFDPFLTPLPPSPRLMRCFDSAPLSFQIWLTPLPLPSDAIYGRPKMKAIVARGHIISALHKCIETILFILQINATLLHIVDNFDKISLRPKKYTSKKADH